MFTTLNPLALFVVVSRQPSCEEMNVVIFFYIGSLHPRDETLFYKEPTSVTPKQDYSSHHFFGLNTSKPTTVVRGSKVLRIPPNFPPERARQNFGMIPLNHSYKNFLGDFCVVTMLNPL